MNDRPAPPIPQRPSLSNLRSAVGECRACDLWEHATQPVMGEGARHAAVMLVGEQPGDKEDRSGEPFVGPAGRVLDDALEQVGLARETLYVTNAVKHFKWTPRGKRRIHQQPSTTEVQACWQWLEREIRAVRPELVIALGATAARALAGPEVRVTRQRGTAVSSGLAPLVVLTVHPSSILRGSPSDRTQAFAAFVDDLRAALALLADQA
jgi:DNA polymerase